MLAHRHEKNTSRDKRESEKTKAAKRGISDAIRNSEGVDARRKTNEVEHHGPTHPQSENRGTSRTGEVGRGAKAH
jgi:hypothetical protein